MQVPDGNDGSQEHLFVGLKIENDHRKRSESVYDIYDAEKGASEATYKTGVDNILSTKEKHTNGGIQIPLIQTKRMPITR